MTLTLFLTLELYAFYVMVFEIEVSRSFVYSNTKLIIILIIVYYDHKKGVSDKQKTLLFHSSNISTYNNRNTIRKK